MKSKITKGKYINGFTYYNVPLNGTFVNMHGYIRGISLRLYIENRYCLTLVNQQKYNVTSAVIHVHTSFIHAFTTHIEDSTSSYITHRLTY